MQFLRFCFISNSSTNSANAQRRKNEERLNQLETKLEDTSTLSNNSKREIDMMQGTIQQMREAMDDFQRKKRTCHTDISK